MKTLFQSCFLPRVFSKSLKQILPLFLLIFGLPKGSVAQITSGNCYNFSINGIVLDYNANTDPTNLFGRTSATGTNTNVFKVESAPSPNATNFTIKTSDGKYITRNPTSNKMSVSANFSDPTNQVFQIVMNGSNINIFLINSQFGLSPMQWANNTQAYILANTSSWVVQPTATTCASVVSAPTPSPTPAPAPSPTTTNSVGWTNSSLGTNNIINSNVGGVIIGTGITATPPGYKLYVSDGILTEQFVVAPKSSTNWADFVFDTNYKLRSLASLKNFININKHLPEIPTTKEVSQNGINLGEISTKQLQKIEELTLYLIKQEEKIAMLTLRVKKLEKK